MHVLIGVCSSLFLLPLFFLLGKEASRSEEGMEREYGGLEETEVVAVTLCRQ